MKITSNACREGEMIPRKHTCDGPDLSPQLAWADLPERTESLALICDDPDAPSGTWVHWVIFNVPFGTRELPEGIPGEEELPDGTRQGRNDFRRIGYGGPCPPGGTHRYYFKLYALDTILDKEAGATKDELLEVMEGHVISSVSLMGRYSL